MLVWRWNSVTDLCVCRGRNLHSWLTFRRLQVCVSQPGGAVWLQDFQSHCVSLTWSFTKDLLIYFNHYKRISKNVKMVESLGANMTIITVFSQSTFTNVCCRSRGLVPPGNGTSTIRRVGYDYRDDEWEHFQKIQIVPLTVDNFSRCTHLSHDVASRPHWEGPVRQTGGLHGAAPRTIKGLRDTGRSSCRLTHGDEPAAFGCLCCSSSFIFQDAESLV